MFDWDWMQGFDLGGEKPQEPAPPPKRGYVKYSPELGEEICDLLAAGKLLHEVCEAEGMPTPSSVYRWKNKYPDFVELYDAAMHARYDKACKDLLDIAADSKHDYETEIKEGKTADDPVEVRHKAMPEVIARSRLRIETMKWIMAHELPRKYGETSAAAIAAPKQEQIEEAAPVVVDHRPENVISIEQAIELHRKNKAAAK
jgi:hypothetical protein